MKPSIVVLIDGDQLGPEPMPALMGDLEKEWIVVERICVRNWRSTRDQQAWREFAATHSFRLIQRDPVTAGKNASDIELAVIAMDLLAAGQRAFCLVSGDMDFTPLVERLRRGGCHVAWVRPSELLGKARASSGPSGRAAAGEGRAGRPARSGRRSPKSTAEAARPASAPEKDRAAAGRQVSPSAAPASGTGRGRRPAKAGGAPAKPAAAVPAAAPAPKKAAAGPDRAGFARAVRRIIEDLRRVGEHERGWVSVNRLGSKLTEAGTSKEAFGFPKRRPLWAALEEAGLKVEQMETGQYRVTLP